MEKQQFRILYREFLFRIVDLELLSAHAEGDSRTLLGQFASLLIFVSVVLTVSSWLWAARFSGDSLPPLYRVIGAWTMEHFLIATTMLVAGLFAVLSWESTFPSRRDVMVLGPLPVRARTLFFAKVAAVGAALGLTVVLLHGFAGFSWPLVLAQSGSTPAPALIFDPALPPVSAADFPGVMNRDIAPLLRRLDLLANDGGAGIVIGISQHGVRRILTYGAAHPNSLFEIGSVTKTFTGLILAQMALENKVDVRDPVRELLPPGVASAPRGPDITLLDLATHHSGLPRMPDNTPTGGLRETYTDYHAAELYDFIRRNGLEKPPKPQFLYSNLGFSILGAALANRAGVSYPQLLQERIAGPLGMTSTAIALSSEQRARFLQGYDDKGRPTAAWDLDAFASAGGIRSDAADMLTYLEAELHPERTPFPAALLASQRTRARVSGSVSIALAWNYDAETGFYFHNGGTGGFTSYATFDPRREAAAVVLLNAGPSGLPFFEILGEHVRQRLAGEPALSLAPVSIPRAGPMRAFFAYWIAMFSAAAFMFCCVLGLQGIAAQLLPRSLYSHASAFLQLAVFCALVSGYFLQRSPVTVLLNSAQQPWIAWVPSYWFAAMYQQLSGSLHPALAPLAERAWIGLALALFATGAAYAATYFRTLRKIVEEPDIPPGSRGNWLPAFGRPFETAVTQFSIRTLLRSRQHRMIFAFYLGAAFAFAILFLNAPPDLAGPTDAGAWERLSIPLLVSTIVFVGLAVVGARTVFAMPIDLRANWTFRAMPFAAGPQCLRARRRALLLLSVAPAWMLCAAVLFSVWPWRPAAAHLTALACLGIILAEFSADGVQRLPFVCSYLPGRSNIHLTFWLWLLLILLGVAAAAAGERKLFESTAGTTALLGCLIAAAAGAVVHNNWRARRNDAELRFEEIPPDQLVSMDLS